MDFVDLEQENISDIVPPDDIWGISSDKFRNEENNIYEDYTVGDAQGLKTAQIEINTNLNLKISQIASGFFVMARRRSAGLLEASQGPTT